MNATPPEVSLTWLFDGIASLPANDVRVCDLALDSREVREGALFFALGGQQSHGLEFAAAAVARGARVVLWEPQGAVAPHFAEQVFAAPIAGLRQLIGRVADRFFGAPSAHLRIVGITGTNGKTTCAYLLAQCLERLQADAAYIGTIGWGRIGALATPKHTTPDVVTLHRQLALLRAAGVSEVVMEVSSHALDQGRVDGVRLHTAAFTNLTRDHLDYHHSMAAYGAAKARLFIGAEPAHAVINIGDGFGRELAARQDGRAALTAVWVGTTETLDLKCESLRAEEVMLDLAGITLRIGGSRGTARVSTHLLGRFNAENCVVVLGCLAALGFGLDQSAAALAGCRAPPGRMEVIGSVRTDKALAVVDYAHTPDALAKALGALREHCRGALWCVFGCGGDRDPGKRPLMGAVVDELADHIIVTDDNPRSENPQEITAAIVGGMQRHAPRVIHERGAAIGAALEAAVANDMVLIAGKGHEEYQIYGTTRRGFSDRQAVLAYLGAAA